MRLEHFRVVRGRHAQTLGDQARVPLYTVSPSLRNLAGQWDPGFALSALQNRFGPPSYTGSCSRAGTIHVWVLWSRRPDNVICIEAWPKNLESGMHYMCRSFDSAVVDFCLWLTRAHLQRHLQPVEGGKA